MTAAFATTYAQARQDFRAAATGRGAVQRTYPLPGGTGPDGGTLSVDTAYLGPPRPRRMLVAVCGTHGIEGFTGSACQTRILLGTDGGDGDGGGDSGGGDSEEFATAADRGLGILLVHALNPYGFAYWRRVNEDNVDLNRNFVDHAAPPHNDAYDRVHAALLDDSGAGPASPDFAARLHRLAGELGLRAFQEAVTHGQYRHHDGLFYGGRQPTRSHRILRAIVAEQIAGTPRVGYIDLHTGLGERGAGEAIFRGGRDPGAPDRARAWYGPGVTDSDAGSSSSTAIVGNTATAVADGLTAGEQLTAITLEFGTLPGAEVLLALCADNGLHLRLDPVAAFGSPDKQLIRAAFSPDGDELWRKQVLHRAREVFSQAVAGLAAVDA
ncbi:Protein of unknown function [Streptomyces sp. DvalAA-14]|uniref:DUF2817 domain-containing protein n=1 Tax=unclassified Streptomyces TaxID=2593676 RepID=UPI00081B238F|nr:MULTISPECIES: DUF2817 domain-containing protein [unclassified Streptomyces]MYS19380.1 DUF2817 domain-containing protein [Streptomyces sp. SID4948]SCD43184.1 Protein of unknown function [Streptomyces sp. DvalAA-14]